MKLFPVQEQAVSALIDKGDRVLVVLPLGVGGREILAVSLDRIGVKSALIVAPNMLHQTWRHTVEFAVKQPYAVSLITPNEAGALTLDFGAFDAVVVELKEVNGAALRLLETIDRQAKVLYLRTQAAVPPDPLKSLLAIFTETLVLETEPA